MKAFASRACLTAILCLFFLFGNYGLAMRIQARDSVFAWSDDGRGCLIEKAEYGPEGGGSLSFRLIVPVRKIDETFEVSRNFSLGGSEEPQTVSESSCRGTLSKLKKRFQEFPFSAVSVDWNAVSVNRNCVVLNNETNGIPGYFWSSTDAKARPQKVKGEFEMRFNGEKFSLKHFDKDVVEWNSGKSAGGVSYEGALSPAGNLFLIFAAGENRDQGLEAVYYRKPGEKEEWGAVSE